MMKNIKIILLAFFSTFCIIGCEDILEPTPQGQVSLDGLLSTESGLITGVNGIYQPLLNFQGYFVHPFDMASDDGWTWRKETEPDLYNLDQTFPQIENIWSNHYTGITRANTVLFHMSSIDEFSSEQMKDAIEGQAKFLRAFYYFNLVRIYGGVPLILERIGSREDSEQPRATISQVYTQIKADLTDAIQLLPTSYTGTTGMEKGRSTSYTASALKAMVHLELEEWGEAASAANAVIGNGSLLPNYADNFNGSNENGSGSLFEIQWGGAIGATTGGVSNSYAPPDLNGGAALLPSDDNMNGEGGGLSSGNGIVQMFDPGDLRRDVVFADYGLVNFIDPSRPDGSLMYIHKYYNTVDTRGQSTWNFPLIRYAEVLLIRAEALNEQGYVADGEAFDLLNETRINAGLTAFTSADLANQDAFRSAVADERRKELAFEGKRYFDLNRRGILATTVQAQMDFLSLTFPTNRLITHPITGKSYYLHPIPLVEFLNNARIGEQNSGYN